MLHSESNVTCKFSVRIKESNVFIHGEVIRVVHTHTFLGAVIDRELTWSPHGTYLKKKLVSFTQLVRYISGSTSVIPSKIGPGVFSCCL